MGSEEFNKMRSQVDLLSQLVTSLVEAKESESPATTSWGAVVGVSHSAGLDGMGSGNTKAVL